MSANENSCPMCKEAVPYFRVVSTETVQHKAYLSTDGDLDYGSSDCLDCDYNSGFMCPNCGHVITEDEDEAKAFLAGKEIEV